MDESWRMRARKSVPEEGPKRHSFTSTLDADDFSDVFGGPPRTVVARKFSADFTTTTTTSSSFNFYSDVFRTPSPVFVSPTKRSGRFLPAFRIPSSKGEGFYCDVFASSDGRKSRERSQPKSNSSSVLSSEEMSPLRPVDREDVAFSSFASNLRPINVPCKWNSTDDHSNSQAIPAFHCNGNRPSDIDNHCMENDQSYNFRSSYCGFSRRVSSPETIVVEPTSYQSIKVSVEDLQPNSPSSPASSLCQEPETKSGFIQTNVIHEQEVKQQDDEVIMSSYVIDINSDSKEGTMEAVSIDEAIAWANEKFHSVSSSTQLQKNKSSANIESERRNANEFFDGQIGGYGTLDSPIMDEQENWATGEVSKEQWPDNMEMEILEEEIRLWSVGKETSICLLLSTLHHVLWMNSGWHAVSLTSLIESSNLQKAYQRARICLHPGKLQQRGATPQQKYVAEKVFSILQEAWAAVISEDIFFWKSISQPSSGKLSFGKEAFSFETENGGECSVDI